MISCGCVGHRGQEMCGAQEAKNVSGTGGEKCVGHSRQEMCERNVNMECVDSSIHTTFVGSELNNKYFV
jgi:hypothetical protein